MRLRGVESSVHDEQRWWQVSIGYRSYGKVPEDQIYLDQASKLYDKALQARQTPRGAPALALRGWVPAPIAAA